MNEWISIHKKIKDHWIYDCKPFCKAFAWIDLFLIADENGEIHTSIRKLSDRWGWSKNKVIRFLNEISKDTLLGQKRDKKETIIIITDCDFARYDETQKVQQKVQQKNTNNNTNNGNKKIYNDKKFFSSESDEIKLSKLLFEKMRLNNPYCREPDFQTWAKHIDLLIRIDKQTVYNIKKVIEWCQNDNFWKHNILSTAKLREKFDSLMLKSCNKTKNNDNDWGNF